MARPRSAVFIAKVPKSFKPTHACTLPREIRGGKFLARRLSLETAVKMAEAYNRTHLPSNGAFRHKWALVIADLKRSYRQPSAQQGGAK
jgi:hypothetical protein